MDHPWAWELRFKKRQNEGPSEDHVWALKGHMLAISKKGRGSIHPAMWNSAWKIWFEWPCCDHVFAIKGPYFAISRKAGYRIHPAMWNLLWSIPVHIDLDSWRTDLKDHVMTMIGPQRCHILAISRKGGYRIHPAMSNLAWSISREIKEEPIWGTILRPCLGHKRAIFWPFIIKGDYRIPPELDVYKYQLF